jgi:hypothetical protein
MSSKNLYRIGGIAAVLSALLVIADIFSVNANEVRLYRTHFGYLFHLFLTNILFILVAWTLDHLYRSAERRLPLAALILSIIGAAVSFITWDSETSPIIWTFVSTLINFVIPILLFGFLAYRYAKLGMPRIFYGLSILYVVSWAIIYIVYGEVELGFVDNLPLIIQSAWLAWTGGVLLFGKLQDSSEENFTLGKYKLESFFATIGAFFKPNRKIIAGAIVAFSVIGIVIYGIYGGSKIQEETGGTSKVISAENADQLEAIPIPELQQQAESQSDLKSLASWQVEGINGTTEDYFFNADGSLVGINTPSGMYLIDMNADVVTHLLPEQPYQHRLKAISPDGKFLITEDNESERMRDQGAFQQRLYLWDAAQLEIIQPLDVALDYDPSQDPYPYLVVLAMKFSSDSSELKALVTVSDNSGDSVKSFVWNMPEGNLISIQVVEDSALIMELVGNSFIYQREYDDKAQVHFLPDDDQIVISNRYVDYYSAKSLTMFSFPEGRRVADIPVGEGDIRITASGNAFATLKGFNVNGSEYSIWGLPTSTTVSTFTVSDSNPSDTIVTFDSPYSYTISPTGNLLAGMISAGKNIMVVKNDGTIIKEIPSSGKVVAFSPREDYIIVHDGSSMMFVNISTSEVVKNISLIQPVGGMTVNPVKDMVAVALPNAVEIYQISSKTLIKSISLNLDHGEPFTPSVSFSADGDYLISQQYDTYSGSDVNIVWDTSEWSIAKKNSWSNDGFSKASPNLFQQMSLMVTPYYNQLGFFDLNDNSTNSETGMAEPVYVADLTSDIVNFQISPDQKYLAYYGGYNGIPQFTLFDLSTATTLPDLEIAMKNPVLAYPVEWVGGGSFAAIAFSSSSDLLAVYDIDQHIYVIDLKMLDLKWKISSYYAPSQLLFSSDGALLFADGPVYNLNEVIFDENDPKEYVGFPLAELPIVGDFIGISHDEMLFVTVSQDGVFTYWEIP